MCGYQNWTIKKAAVLRFSVVSDSLQPHGLYSPWVSSVPRGFSKARILEWVVLSSSRGSSQPRDQTQVSRIAGRFFTFWATKEAERRLSTKELMFPNCGAGEDSWESLGQHGDQTSQSQRKSTLNWKDWCWSWSFSSLATWCKELTHWKRPWCWERLKAGEEVGDRRQDGWMASLTQWIWVWANSGR